MAKYKVCSYYEYMAVSEVEANSPKEAFEIGYKLNQRKGKGELEFVDYTNSEVVDENWETHEFK